MKRTTADAIQKTAKQISQAKGKQAYKSAKITYNHYQLHLH